MVLAGWTGLEPAASGVTGQRYNQLNYHPKQSNKPLFTPAIQAVQVFFFREAVFFGGGLSISAWVGETGFEPVTLGL